MGTKGNREPSNTLPLLAAVRSVLLTFALAAGGDHHRSMPTGRTAPIATPRSIELRRLGQEAADPRKAAAARTTLRQVLEMLVE